MKRARLEAVPPSRVLRSLLLDEGLTPVFRSFAKGYEITALAEGAMFLGQLRGARRARRLAIESGRFAGP